VSPIGVDSPGIINGGHIHPRLEGRERACSDAHGMKADAGSSLRASVAALSLQSGRIAEATVHLCHKFYGIGQGRVIPFGPPPLILIHLKAVILYVRRRSEAQRPAN
jgi:hypothetical protein